MEYLLIRESTAWRIDLSAPDVMAIPPTASLVTADDWAVMCKEAGGEEALLQTLGVKEMIDGQTPTDMGVLDSLKG